MNETTENKSGDGDLVQFNAPDFGVIPAELICDAKLTSSARNLGCLMWTYRNKDTGDAWPSQKTLAARLETTPRTVGRWMKALRKRGWMSSHHRISVDPTYKGNPGALIHTLYWNRTSVSENKGKQDTRVRSNRTSMSGTGGHPTTQEHTNRTDQMNSNSNRASISKSEKALLDAQVFPRKVAKLIREYSEEFILQKAKHFTGGELVRAIEEDWQPREKQRSAGRGGVYDPKLGEYANFWDMGRDEDV